MKVCKVDFPTDSHEWNEIIKLNLFRNCIIHAQGNVDKVKSATKLRKVIENTEGVELKNDRYLVVEKAYVESAIRNVKKLLEVIYDKTL